MRPEPIAFCVPLALLDPETGAALGPRWLGPTGEAVDVEANAVIFTMHRSPTPRELLRIDQRNYDLAGGMQAFLRLQRSSRAARAQTIALLSQEVWGDKGRPEHSDKAREIDEDQALERAWAATDLIEKAIFQETQAQLDRQDFMARWAVLIVDPPKGWEDIADREIPEAVLYAIIRARNSAFEPVTLGKQPPSAS